MKEFPNRKSTWPMEFAEHFQGTEKLFVGDREMVSRDWFVRGHPPNIGLSDGNLPPLELWTFNRNLQITQFLDFIINSVAIVFTSSVHFRTKILTNLKMKFQLLFAILALTAGCASTVSFSWNLSQFRSFKIRSLFFFSTGINRWDWRKSRRFVRDWRISKASNRLHKVRSVLQQRRLHCASVRAAQTKWLLWHGQKQILRKARAQLAGRLGTAKRLRFIRVLSINFFMRSHCSVLISGEASLLFLDIMAFDFLPLATAVRPPSPRRCVSEHRIAVIIHRILRNYSDAKIQSSPVSISYSFSPRQMPYKSVNGFKMDPQFDIRSKSESKASSNWPSPLCAQQLESTKSRLEKSRARPFDD